MDISRYMKQENEKPLDNIVENGGFCGIFRTIACIGDSLASGEFERIENGKGAFYDCFDYSWGQYMARDIGAKVYNFSRGGMTAEEYCREFAKSMGYWDRELAAQAYIVALGVNDVSRTLEGNVVFGSIDDVNPNGWEQNAPTFAGYYGEIISRYKEIQPGAKFFLMTMPHDKRSEDREALFDRHRELIYQMAKNFDNCYVLDFREYAPVYDETFRESFYLAGHMNPAGYRLTALMVESYMDYIIRNNPKDFARVGFVEASCYHPNKKQ